MDLNNCNAILDRKVVTCCVSSERKAHQFAGHEQVNRVLGSDSYFCKPYASWEKGGVENFNGLIRQYLPKQSSLKHISADYLDEIVTEINSRPKKVLNWKKPIEFELELTA